MTPVPGKGNIEYRVQAVENGLNSQLKDLSSKDLFALEKTLSSLMEHPGWVHLQQITDERADAIMARLVHGVTPEKHEFAALLSMVSGIEQVVLAPLAVIERARKVRAELDAKAAVDNSESDK